MLLTQSGIREETNTIYTKHSSGFNSPDRTFKGKCWRCDGIGHTARYCRKSKNHTCEEMLQNRTLTGLLTHKAITRWRRGRGRGKQNVRSIEKRDIGVEENDTFYVFSMNPSAYVMPINTEEKYVRSGGLMVRAPACRSRGRWFDSTSAVSKLGQFRSPHFARVFRKRH